MQNSKITNLVEKCTYIHIVSTYLKFLWASCVKKILISDFSTFTRKSPHLESKQLPNWISKIGKLTLLDKNSFFTK